MHPLLFELQIGSWTIPFHTYGLMIALGFILGITTVRRLAVASGLDPDEVSDLSFWLLMYGFLGSRILFVITRFEDYVRNPLDIFKVWEGGLVFFGGLILATVYAFHHFRKRRLDAWKMIDVLAPGLVIAHAFGRLGCLGAGCCYGRPTGSFLGVKFESDLVEQGFRGIPLHPVQAYEFVALLVLYFGLLGVFRHRKIEGQVGLTYFMTYPLIRGLVELFRGDSIRGFVIGHWLSTSQFISIWIFLGAWFVLVRRLGSVARP
jgi:phosphatidylglycerol:prolipoprotein diacylglycerol transferase